MLFWKFMLVSSSLLLDYRFGIDIGDIFYDYSGNSNHAINNPRTKFEKFVKTDRGIYSPYGNCSLEVSNNKINCSRKTNTQSVSGSCQLINTKEYFTLT